MGTEIIYGETTWAMAIAEAVDSSGGTAGDGITLNFTSTSTDNKIVYLFSNKLKKSVKSKDETQHMVKARSRTTKLGNIVQTVTISQALIPGKDITDLNDLDDQLDNWIINGNAQAGVKAVYFIARMKVGGNWRYKTFRNAGIKQNWLKCEIKNNDSDITNERLMVNLKLEESDT